MNPDESICLPSLVDENGNSDIDSSVVYLDYGGAALPPRSVMMETSMSLCSGLYLNPHSGGGVTYATIQECRSRVLNNIVGSDDYVVIFTSGATAALKLVADIFPWTDNSHFVYSKNVHNSVLSIRQSASQWHCLPSHATFGAGTDFESPFLFQPREGSDANAHHLLALPGECNLSGARFDPVRAVALLKQLQSTSPNHNWMYLLDTAKLFASSSWQVSSLPAEYRPHFLTVSFYKIFGYPTGLGALIVRKDIMPLLRKRYFGGGTLSAGAADSSFFVPRNPLTAAHYEDGTPHIHGLAALQHGFAFINKLGGMKGIEQHGQACLQYLLQGLQSLRHGNNLPLIILHTYHHDTSKITATNQGPTLAFTLHNSYRSVIPYGNVQRLAAMENIYLRTGCCCNLGGCAELLGHTAADLEHFFALGRRCDEHDDNSSAQTCTVEDDDGQEIQGEYVEVIRGKSTGVVRVSMGYGTTKEHIDTLLAFFAKHFLNARADDAATIAQNDKKLEEEEVDDNLYWTRFSVAFPGTVNSTAANGRMMVNQEIYLEAIFVYPIKGAAGVRVSSWPLRRHCHPPHYTGALLFDRLLAVIDYSHYGRVVTQKTHPQLALIRPSFRWADNNTYLVLTSVTLKTSLEIMLDINSLDQEQKKLRVCGRTVAGRRVSSTADEWISSFLDGNFGLIYCTDEDEDSFINTAPLLLLTIPSVVELRTEINKQQGDDSSRGKHALQLKVENFRPNLVLSGSSLTPFIEDTWSSLQLAISGAKGSLTLPTAGRCQRCAVVDTHGQLGQATLRIFEAIRGFRPGASFGQFLGGKETIVDGEEEMVMISIGPILEIISINL